MTKVFFVRHAQPDFKWVDDLTRPLTQEGEKDKEVVTDFFRDKVIDRFCSSPYKRSMDTIRGAAQLSGKDIVTDVRLREREKGNGNSNTKEMMRMRWADFQYHEEGGESLAMVQKRNMEALEEILRENEGKSIVIGTHGTALSTILNYYDRSFGCDDFLRIIDWMPYVIELEFEGVKLVRKTEHLHVEKVFRG